VAAEENLYFVELPSSQDAVTRRVGREAGVPVIPADAELDARRLPAATERTRAQVTALVARAHATGRAVATVHADSATCATVLGALRALEAHVAPPSTTL
jgi:polysaccharide deacetylase 2 family uncharacterized protein YibQ